MPSQELLARSAHSEEGHANRPDGEPQSREGRPPNRELLRISDTDVCQSHASKQQRVTRTPPYRPCDCDEEEQNPANQEKTPSRDSLPRAEMGAGIFDVERVPSDGSKVSDVTKHGIQDY